MALAEKYVILFQKECMNLSKIVLTNLHKLKINPKDSQSMEKMLQAADTIIGDSRFINHTELEHASMHLVNTFGRIENAVQHSHELEFFIKTFSRLINK